MDLTRKFKSMFVNEKMTLSERYEAYQGRKLISLRSKTFLQHLSVNCHYPRITSLSAGRCWRGDGAYAESTTAVAMRPD